MNLDLNVIKVGCDLVHIIKFIHKFYFKHTLLHRYFGKCYEKFDIKTHRSLRSTVNINIIMKSCITWVTMMNQIEFSITLSDRYFEKKKTSQKVQGITKNCKFRISARKSAKKVRIFKMRYLPQIPLGISFPKWVLPVL